MNQPQEQFDAWKRAVIEAEAVGREIEALNRRIAANRKQFAADRIAEQQTETSAFASRASRHDD